MQLDLFTARPPRCQPLPPAAPVLVAADAPIAWPSVTDPHTFTFLLGIHKPSFLADPRLAGVPFLISRGVLESADGRVLRNLPRAPAPYAIDSRGFTELQMFGRWTLTVDEYIARIRAIVAKLGRDNLLWIAPMDWMAEPIVRRGGEVRTGGRVVRFAGTKMPVRIHLYRTVMNFLDLRERAPDLPWMPVIQGWELDDYLECLDLYAHAGVDLFAEPIVGLGSVCRRQDTVFAARLVEMLFYMGLRLHGFGMKIKGLVEYHRGLASSDSLAWSEHARRRPALPGHREPGFRRPKGHQKCASCLEYALLWRDKLLAGLADRERAFELAALEWAEAEAAA